MSKELAHYGIKRRSGRYPWGSGEDPYQRTQNFRARAQAYKAEGLKETEIAKAFGISTTQYRARMAIAKYEKRCADEAKAAALKDKGLSNVEIGKRMGLNESSVRALFDKQMQARNRVLENTADIIADAVDKHKYVDVGAGVDRHLGISRDKLNTAVAMLQEQGYKVHYLKEQQLGTGELTQYKVLAKEGVSWSEVNKNRSKIKPPIAFSEDSGLTFNKVLAPVSIDSKRVKIRYGEEGGGKKDGVIELRRGMDDISMGSNRYAQVRIAVDGTHYLKGMAVYSDHMPKGVDVIFNTPKSKKTPKMEVLKKLEDDPEMPFKAAIKTARQHVYIDPKTGEKKRSAVNIVNSEGDWADWSKTIASQILSKQKGSVVREQLEATYKGRKRDFNELLSLTNPVLKRKLLDSFADDCDAAATHLKTAPFKRQGFFSILPMPGLSPKEVYAPRYKNGETVVLIRYPHGGIFEIPELKVNNKTPEARKLFGKHANTVPDAIGINHKVAEKLSGADFDGDAVLVIPNNSGKLRSRSSLDELKGFDPKIRYAMSKDRPAGYRPRMTKRQTQTEMGKVTNLITDMTVKGASFNEIARAVRHSMVVIDARKHDLDFRQSEIDNGISQLKEKYQTVPGRKGHGAATLLSRSNATVYVEKRKPRPMSEGGPVDPKTGRKVWVSDNRPYIDKHGKLKNQTTKSQQMMETDDARKLSSGTEIEGYYAKYSNSLKAMANEARKASLNTKVDRQNKSAASTYSAEVASLKAKLNIAKKNAPLERRAMLVANQLYKERKEANPQYDEDDLKKLKNKCLNLGRERIGAKKERIPITDKEWRAIQEGAVAPTVLEDIFRNTDLERLKRLATPRETKAMSSSKVARAKAMLDRGYTQSEVADALGVSTSTLLDALK